MKHSDGPSASAIAAVVVAVFLATACTAGQGVASPTPASAPRASTTPTPSVVAPSAARSASPSASTALLTWTPASLEEDWPAPVRAEPAGGATVVPIRWKVVTQADGVTKEVETGSHEDPIGDTQSGAFPWVDIHAVSFCRNKACPVVSVPGPPDVDPTEQWIAYGLVVDDNGDGIADRRFGVDNIPETTAGKREHRAWITDLHTGQTVSMIQAPSEFGDRFGDTYLNTFFPAPHAEQAKMSPCAGDSNPSSLSAAEFDFGGGDVAGPGPNGGGSRFGPMPTLFYAWASVIVDGRVVATDYAPDAGWLHPSSNAPPVAGEVAQPSAGEVAPPIDSVEEAIAAVGQLDSRLPGFYELDGYVWRGTDSHGWSDTGFQPCNTYAPGASCRLEAEARGDGWDLTFVCGPATLFARSTFGGCPVGCRQAHAKFHVSRDGTVNALCEWQEGEAVGSPVPGDYTSPFDPPESEKPAATPC